LNTAAKLHHFHNPAGRPNQYLYGKMVVRNGYVWRTKNPRPSVKHKLKWHAITIINGDSIYKQNSSRKEALTEALVELLAGGVYG
jgi:hypothetical protein